MIYIESKLTNMWHRQTSNLVSRNSSVCVLMWRRSYCVVTHIFLRLFSHSISSDTFVIFALSLAAKVCEIWKTILIVNLNLIPNALSSLLQSFMSNEFFPIAVAHLPLSSAAFYDIEFFPLCNLRNTKLIRIISNRQPNIHFYISIDRWPSH